jgi:hypothetical protein
MFICSDIPEFACELKNRKKFKVLAATKAKHNGGL